MREALDEAEGGRSVNIIRGKSVFDVKLKVTDGDEAEGIDYDKVGEIVQRVVHDEIINARRCE